MKSKGTDQRRRSLPADGAYLALVGERVRLARARRGMSRKVLSQASGVSERYLAELEHGSGNASLLVLRQIAAAIGIAVTDLVAEAPEPAVELKLAIGELERLSETELQEARAWIAKRFGRAAAKNRERIALIGLRGAGKTTLGSKGAAALGLPFIELDREIESASGVELSEIFAAHGQAFFRKLELECLERVVKSYDRAVIATGGSLVTQPATFDLLLSTCYVVWLKAAPEEHMARVAAQGDLRPMAASRQAMEDLRAILDSRTALYARADAVLDTTSRAEGDSVADLLAMIGACAASETAK
jgi:XRE family aerobic/anaerobic benzoate catabolism transcriptional regulator